MRWALLPLLVGCGNPISNQQIYEDELFLAALPSVARLAPPREVRFARVGTSGLLEEAVGQADGLDGLAVVVGGSGEALRGAKPNERSDAVRSWRKVATAGRLDGESTTTWWVRGEVVQPVGSAGLDWTIEASIDGSDPWITVGSGLHDPAGAGRFTWQVEDHALLLGIPDPVPAVLEFDYVDPGEEVLRELHIDDNDLELGGTWSVAGENTLSWLGGVVLVQGQEPAPGAAEVAHDPEAGGYGLGALFTPEGELPFEVCWDANGNDVWLSGGGQPDAGSPADCPITPPGR